MRCLPSWLFPTSRSIWGLLMLVVCIASSTSSINTLDTSTSTSSTSSTSSRNKHKYTDISADFRSIIRPTSTWKSNLNQKTGEEGEGVSWDAATNRERLTTSTSTAHSLSHRNDRKVYSSKKFEYPSSTLISNDMYIVHLEESHEHADVERYLDSLVAKSLIKQHTVHSRLHHVFRGFVIELLSVNDEQNGEDRVNILKNVPGVRRVVRDTYRYLRVLPEYLSLPKHKDAINKVKGDFNLQRTLIDSGLWGLDRIDQESLPLNNQYLATFTGKGVDVYVVDTGIDTTHDEFKTPSGSSSVRQVLNIWDAFSKVKSHPSTNTDGQGHGTHVAGTVGGINVGVSPHANLYGLKVLSDEGSGSTSDIVTALDFAMSRSASSGRRSVLTMSLGGPCDDDDCSKDSLVIASEKLISAGIILSVAAGNEGCNACSGSPNSAPHTINVGASDDKDSLCYFSNFGQCVDVIAPGFDILSSCSSKVCDGSDYYLTMSGTSMATPHVAGVIAQLLEKYPTSTQPEILEYMTCDSVHETIKVGYQDGITRNLLLHVPASSDTASTCAPSSGCTPECSSNGVCLPMFAPSNPEHSPSSLNTCHCNGGTYGTTCSASSDPSCVASNNNKQSVTMYDQFGDGWSFTNYAILDANGYIYNNIYDSLCYDDFGTHDYCLPDGNYQFVVSRGPFPNEVGWAFCGVSGGAPYTANFVITSGGKTCSISCPSASKQILYLFDSYGDGWNGAYYSIYDESGDQLYGGMLSNDQESDSHTVCLPTGKFYLIFPNLGSNPEEVSMKINGMMLYPDSAAILVVDSSFHVSVTVPTISQCTQPDASSTSTLNAIGLLKINLLSKGWQSGTYEVKNTLSNLVVASGGMQSGFLELDTMCIPDGCYNFNAQLASTDDVQLANNKDSFWTACGSRGLIPWQSKFCIEGQFDLCYGIDGSPYAKSYAPHSSGQFIILSHHDDEYDMSVVDSLTNVHGVNDFSGLDDGCYSFVLGAGKELVAGRDSVYFSCDDMKLSYKMPTLGEVCMNNNVTTCKVTHFTHQTCTGSMFPMLFAKVDLNGDGWGTDTQAYYRIKDKNSKIVAHGNLKEGQYGVDKICLNINQCYKLSVDSTSYPDEVLWIHCGLVGGAGSDYMNIEFCVTPAGCYFTSIGDDVYNKEVDDDFPQSAILTIAPSIASTLMPSRAPTRLPTHIPTRVPTIAAAKSAPPSFSPTISLSPTILSTAAPSVPPSTSPTETPTMEPSLAPFSVYDANIDVTVSINFVDLAAASSTTESQLQFIEYATRQVVEENGLSVWESGILSLSINSNSHVETVEKKKKSYMLKSAVMRSLNSAETFGSLFNIPPRGGEDKGGRNVAAKSTGVILSIITRVHLAIEWKSSIAISAEKLTSLLESIIQDSVNSGLYQINLDYSLRYFKDHGEEIPIVSSGVDKFDVVDDMEPPRIVSPNETPALDDTFEQITWPSPPPADDTSDGKDSKSNAVNEGSHSKNDLIIGLVGGIFGSVLMILLYRKLCVSNGYKSLGGDSLHGGSKHNNEVEMNNSMSKSSNGLFGNDSIDFAVSDNNTGSSKSKNKNKKGGDDWHDNGYILSANESRTPTPDADVEHGSTWRPAAGGNDDDDDDDDNDVVSVVHLNRQFDTKPLSKNNDGATATAAGHNSNNSIGRS